MAKSKSSNFFQTVQIGAGLATIGSLIFAIWTAVAPDTVSKMTKDAINYGSKYITGTGEVRPSVAEAQTIVFLITAAVFVVIFILVWSGFIFARQETEAKNAAIGIENKKGYYVIIGGVIFFVFVALGIALPRAIFNPTHMRTLELYFPLGAMAKKSWFGGVAIGAIGTIISYLGVLLFKWIANLRYSMKEKRMKERIRLT